MEGASDIVVCGTEFIEDRLYFVTLNTDGKPKSTPNTHYFSIDKELQYENFYADFGPLNISMLYHYSTKLNKKLKSIAIQKKKIVHYTTTNENKRVNAAYLIGSYAIIYLNYTPEQALDELNRNNPDQFVMFRDASIGITTYHISLLDCLKAIHRGLKYGFFNFESFDFLEYEHYERVEHGDLNWILPNKFIAFCGPHNRSRLDNGYPLHSPETYFSYFRRHNVTTIVRLNKKTYDSNKFKNAGFDHKDLYFIDGSTPSDAILEQFISICEKTVGVVAVHCKAGLGRTGSLIGCFIMKHYKMTAHETIAWIRICRPGSIIGHQQNWLENKQAQMWREGELYRRKKKLDRPVTHLRGIYNFENEHNNETLSVALSKTIKQNDNVSRILKKVDTMKLSDRDEDNCNIMDEDELVSSSPITQGDKLNQIKALRRQVRPAPSVDTNKLTLRARARLVTTPVLEPPIRGSKLVSIGAKVPSTSSSRVLTKRNKIIDMQPLQSLTPRRTRSTATPTKTPPVSKTPVVCAENNENGFTLSLNQADSQDPKTTLTLKTVKRSKRSLNNEKDKGNNCRGIKVLRRSDPTIAGSKPSISTSPTSTQLHLPIVRVTKCKTP